VLGTGAPRDGLAIGNVFIDPDLLPTEKLAECVRAVLRQPGLATIYDAQGYPPLRRAIAARLAARGIEVDADAIVVTTGSQQALDIVARALEVRRVAIETPVYAYAKLLFESLQLQLTGLPLDPFAGIDLAAWERALAAGRPGLLYAISSFHNPTGYSYTTGDLLGRARAGAPLRGGDRRGRLGLGHAVGQRVPADAAAARRRPRAVRQQLHQEALAVDAGRLRRRSPQPGAVAPGDEAPVDARQRLAVRGGGRRVPRARLLRRPPGRAAGGARRALSGVPGHARRADAAERCAGPGPGGGPTLWVEVPRVDRARRARAAAGRGGRCGSSSAPRRSSASRTCTASASASPGSRPSGCVRASRSSPRRCASSARDRSHLGAAARAKFPNFALPTAAGFRSILPAPSDGAARPHDRAAGEFVAPTRPSRRPPSSTTT
jgi:hypothetical protein